MVAFKQVDVFTSVPFKGNPVAVILDATGLSTDQMKAIANWTNLSETTFVLPPTDNLKADYKLRIFVPSGEELSFAGHPTIGTAFALLESGLITPKNNNLIQECGAGLINLTINETNCKNENSISISFELPTPIITSINENQLSEIEEFLNSKINISSIHPAIINVGPKWLVVNLSNANDVLNTKPNFEKMKIHNQNLNINGVCIFGFYENDPNHIEVRSFAPACDVNEDPVCGSGNGSVTALIRKFYKGDLNNSSTVNLNSTQGSKLGRDGHIKLQFSNDRILVGGNAVTCIKGDINV